MTEQERAESVVAGMLEKDEFTRWLGAEVLDVAPGRATLRMKVRPEMLNGFGVCHGGVVFSLADSALAFACNSSGKVTVSIENSISYPVSTRDSDVLTASAEEEGGGRRISFFSVTVRRSDGLKVALFRGTVYRTDKAHPLR